MAHRQKPAPDSLWQPVIVFAFRLVVQHKCDFALKSTHNAFWIPGHNFIGQRQINALRWSTVKTLAFSAERENVKGNRAKNLPFERVHSGRQLFKLRL